MVDSNHRAQYNNNIMHLLERHLFQQVPHAAPTYWPFYTCTKSSALNLQVAKNDYQPIIMQGQLV